MKFKRAYLAEPKRFIMMEVDEEPKKEKFLLRYLHVDYVTGNLISGMEILISWDTHICWDMNLREQL